VYALGQTETAFGNLAGINRHKLIQFLAFIAFGPAVPVCPARLHAVARNPDFNTPGVNTAIIVQASLQRTVPSGIHQDSVKEIFQTNGILYPAAVALSRFLGTRHPHSQRTVREAGIDFGPFPARISMGKIINIRFGQSPACTGAHGGKKQYRYPSDKVCFHDHARFARNYSFSPDIVSYPESTPDKRNSLAINRLFCFNITCSLFLKRRKGMTKADIIDVIYNKVGGVTKKESAKLVEAVFSTMKGTLSRGEKIKISGFGNFVVRQKKERIGRNPQTGNPITISRRSVLSFKPSQILKAALNKR